MPGLGMPELIVIGIVILVIAGMVFSLAWRALAR
jgi:hypothetical protein